MAFSFIHDPFPDVLAWVGNEYCLQPFDWPCIEVNSPWEIKDNARFDTIFREVMKAIETPWVLEATPKP